MRISVAVFLAAALTALAGCKSDPNPTPLEQLNARETHGHAVFQAHCLVCHSDRTSVKLAGPPMGGLFKKQYLPSGAAATDERVTATIVRGRNMMPAQGNSLDSQELDDLLAYLHTL